MASSNAEVEEFIFTIALQKILAPEMNIQVPELQEVTKQYLMCQNHCEVLECSSANSDTDNKNCMVESKKSMNEKPIYEHINSLLIQGKVRFHRAFLMLTAPKDDEEVISRKEEYISFLSRYKGVKENPELNPYEIVPIYSFDQAMTEIGRFLTCKGDECILPQIIFNGHGTESGQLKIGEEYVQNDIFISAIETLSREHWTPNEQSDMKIVLAQCYSHEVPFDPILIGLHVVRLSTAASPKTFSKKTITKQSNVIHVTHDHLQLNELADALNREHDTGDSTMGLANEINKLHPDKSPRVDSNMDLDQ